MQEHAAASAEHVGNDAKVFRYRIRTSGACQCILVALVAGAVVFHLSGRTHWRHGEQCAAKVEVGCDAFVLHKVVLARFGDDIRTVAPE